MADQQAGWYPDPSGDASKLRYWDGAQWTNDFTNAQQAAQPVAAAQPLPVQQEQPVQAAQPVQPVQPVQPAQPTYTYTASGQQPGVNPAYTQAAPVQSNGLAIASLICGIVGICFGLFSIVAIITGVMGRKNPVNRGMATAGMILGIVGVVLWVFGVIIYGAAIAMYY